MFLRQAAEKLRDAVCCRVVEVSWCGVDRSKRYTKRGNERYERMVYEWIFQM